MLSTQDDWCEALLQRGKNLTLWKSDVSRDIDKTSAVDHSAPVNSNAQKT